MRALPMQRRSCSAARLRVRLACGWLCDALAARFKNAAVTGLSVAGFCSEMPGFGPSPPRNSWEREFSLQSSHVDLNCAAAHVNAPWLTGRYFQ